MVGPIQTWRVRCPNAPMVTPSAVVRPTTQSFSSMSSATDSVSRMRASPSAVATAIRVEFRATLIRRLVVPDGLHVIKNIILKVFQQAFNMRFFFNNVFTLQG